MTIQELKEKLEGLKVPKRIYSILSDSKLGEQYCIKRIGFSWEVYYSERGQKSSQKLFFTEAEACDYFLDQILRTKHHWHLYN